MKNETLNMLAKCVSKFFEIVFFCGAAVMIFAAVLSFVQTERIGAFLLSQAVGGTVGTNGFAIMIQDPNGNFIPVAIRIFTFAGILTMSCMAMICRNMYLIIQTCEGRTRFSTGKTPFQKGVVRKVREIGILGITIPVIGLLLSVIARFLLGDDLCETSVNVVGIAMGIAMLCFSRIFAYGIKLEEEVEGLV